MRMAVAETTKPLRDRLIVVTRAREQAGGFRELLEEAGATVLSAPTIVIEPPESWEPLDRALGEVSGYRWVIFTSVNGVDMVRRRLGERGRGGEVLAGARVAAIGPATAEALSAWGVVPELVPEEYVAEGLAARLGSLVRPGDRVLLPRAAEAREVLVRELGRMGARVDEVPAYRTRPSREGAGVLREALSGGRVDAVTFTSSSTVRHFAALFDRAEISALMDGVVVACIGPVTRTTAAEHGLPTQIMPDTYTIAALAEAIAAHFAGGHGADRQP